MNLIVKIELIPYLKFIVLTNKKLNIYSAFSSFNMFYLKLISFFYLKFKDDF